MCPEEDPRVRARRIAMDLLARREHSRRELERKLRTREVPAGLATEVLDELIADGLLDNARFAEAFVRSRSGRGRGPRKILAELAERGIDASLAERALRAGETDWTALAEEVLGKRFGNTPIRDLKDRTRRMRFLAQRGFTREQSSAALGRSQQVREPVSGEEL